MSALEEELVSRAPSQHGRRWRSLVCAVTRNEWHLREWLLRTLYVGVSHVVLVDDNHAGLDRDISALLRPLIALGLVTHAPSVHCGDRCVAQKSWDDVHARTRACVREHANLTDWLLLIDTDEHIYAEHDGATRDALSQVLGLLEHEGGHGALVPWSMMYGEQLTLEAQIPSEGGLMRAFPRVLSVAQMTKPIGMPEHVTFRPPHRFNGCVRGRGRCSWRAARACRDGICTVGGGRGRLALLHYFQKTVQSFLLKRDISLPHQRQTGSRALRAAALSEPSGIRSLCSMYDNGRFGQAHDCRSLHTFPFAPSYLRGVARLLEATNGWGDAGRTRWIPPHRAGAPDTREVHDIFRRTIAAGLAFSPKLYAQAVAYDRARYCDELQHLLHSRCSRATATQRSPVVGTSEEWMVPVVSSVSGSGWRHNST